MSARGALIARARFAAVPVVAIVFALPREIVLARNAARPGRVVDATIVERHLERLESALPALRGEAFDWIVVLNSPAEVEVSTVVRGPA